MTTTIERVATERPVISLEGLMYTGTAGAFFFVYRSVWMDRCPNHRRSVQLREYLESSQAELVIESEQEDYQMAHRKSVLSVYRLHHG